MSGKKKGYSELLRDPRWQKARLLILERDNFACQSCGAKFVALRAIRNGKEYGGRLLSCVEHQQISGVGRGEN